MYKKPVFTAFCVAGAIFGEVQVSLFLAGAVFGEVQVSLFVAGAALREIWNDSWSAKLLLYFSIARGVREK